MSNFKEKSILEKIIFIVFFPIFLIEKALIFIYKILISPILPKSCKFIPTCSTYFLNALNEYGLFKGTYIGSKRLLRCNPWSKGGFDFVKPNIKGKIKWIL